MSWGVGHPDPETCLSLMRRKRPCGAGGSRGVLVLAGGRSGQDGQEAGAGWKGRREMVKTPPKTVNGAEGEVLRLLGRRERLVWGLVCGLRKLREMDKQLSSILDVELYQRVSDSETLLERLLKNAESKKHT